MASSASSAPVYYSQSPRVYSKNHQLVHNVSNTHHQVRFQNQRNEIVSECRSKIWAIAVACLQIFLAAFIVVTSLTTIISKITRLPGAGAGDGNGDGDSYFNGGEDNESTESYGYGYESRSGLEKYTKYISNPHTQLLLGILAFALGCVLLAGIFYKKQSLLVTWLCVIGLGLVISVVVVLVIVFSILIAGGDLIAVMIVVAFSLIPIGILVLVLHVVHNYHRKLAQVQNYNSSQIRRRQYPNHHEMC